METSDSQCDLITAVTDMLKTATKTAPVHWTVLVDRFINKGSYNNDELVQAVNSLLRPLGRLQGANHNFWFE